MDLYCTRCAEPWDLDHVLHEAEPDDFVRQGGWIQECPECMGKPEPKLPQELREKLEVIREIAHVFCDDIDGFAVFLEDLMVLGG